MPAQHLHPYICRVLQKRSAAAWAQPLESAPRGVGGPCPPGVREAALPPRFAPCHACSAWLCMAINVVLEYIYGL